MSGWELKEKKAKFSKEALGWPGIKDRVDSKEIQAANISPGSIQIHSHRLSTISLSRTGTALGPAGTQTAFNWLRSNGLANPNMNEILCVS